jgi:hypothetical protein
MGLPFLHHAYLYFPGDLEFKAGCGMQGSSGLDSGGIDPDNHFVRQDALIGQYPAMDVEPSDGGFGPPGSPGVIACYKVKNIDGSDLTPEQRAKIRDCICSRFRNIGPWLPFLNDCHNKTDSCIAHAGALVPVDGRIGDAPACEQMVHY